MEYSVIFAFLMGLLFAMLAINKTGTITVPLVGGFVTIVFFAVFNTLALEGSAQNEWVWYNPGLWIEADATAFIGAFAGMKNTYLTKVNKRGFWRYIVPIILSFVTCVLL